MSAQILSLDGASQTLGKHDSRRAIVEQNAQSFPLLRLPLEIRCQIYREVLGDRFIHLKSLRDTSRSIIGSLEGNMHWMDFMYWAEVPRTFEAGDGWLQYVCNKDGPYSKDELGYLGMTYDARKFTWAVPKVNSSGSPVLPRSRADGAPGAPARRRCRIGAYPPGIPARFRSGVKLPEEDEVRDASKSSASFSSNLQRGQSDFMGHEYVLFRYCQKLPAFLRWSQESATGWLEELASGRRSP